ncbi:hypothetical protein MMK58_006735, partial [Pseudomonas aeruginosa]|nr:hypothetical protein [Pseudomonas aeruginosa]
MKTLEQIKNRGSKTLDGRDFSRLARFIPEDQLADFGMTLNEKYVGKHEHIEFNRENVLEELKKDVEFGFKKALGQRGISAALMFEVVSMWNWVLE